MSGRGPSPAFSRHAAAIWLALVLIAIGGVIAATRLPVALFPHIDYPRITIAIDAGERDAAQMEAEITRPIEIALRGVPGVTRIRSTTSRGTAEVALSFAWGDDMASATLATQGALATILPDLPPATRFTVRRSDPTIFPVLGIALTSATLDQRALRQIAELKVRPALSSVAGVAGVDLLGGTAPEFSVAVDPARLSALGLSIADVSAALAKANVVQGAGRIEDRHRLYLVLVEARVTGAKALADVPVKAGSTTSAGVVRLGDIATISPSVEPDYTRITAGGHPAVLVNVRQALNGDTVAIVRAVDARLRAAGLPPSVVATPFYDQSELVTGAADAVRDAILLGALLAGLVLFLFLRSGRLMLITGLMLPVVLAATCLVLKVAGLGFNMMTLGGMAAAVGLVVDDAVVMLEHVMRRMQEGAARGAEGVLTAAGEVARPLYGSTLATIVVFLPLAFVSGVTGGFFKSLAVTMVAALALSLLCTRIAIPLAAARWLRPSDAEAADRAGRMMDRLASGYTRAARPMLSRPELSAAIVGIVLAVAGYVAWTHVPSGFMPKMDEGGFILDYKVQPGAAIDDTDGLLKQVEREILTTPEVASYSRRLGAQLGGGISEVDEGDYFIRLKGGRRRGIEAVMTDLRQRLAARVPGVQVETAQLMEDLIGDLTAVPQPIEVKLFGDDPAELEHVAGQVAKTLGAIPGVVEVIDGLRVAGDGIAVTVDPPAARQQGLDPQAIADQVQGWIGGQLPTSVRIGPQLVGVRVRGPATLDARVAQLAALPLAAPDGHLVRLSQVARVTIAAGQKQLTREDLSPFIAVTARLEGRDLGSAMRDVQARVAGLSLPASVRVDYGGLYAEQRQSFADLAMVFAAALLLAGLLLTILFGRMAWTLAALATVVLSAASVLIGLWLTGIELDISALMGLTMIVGMVTELIIFYLAEIDTTRPFDVAAALEAGEKRLRPILMSAIIAVLTLSPLALGLSRGAGLQQPLATAVIFGLVAAVPLVLLLLPALCMIGGRSRMVA
ncbi:efflux RND transporter permease subunit [Sphingomonas donggukensis]|uniref:Efflux RND transporter permease subunit n=1 Tax=Sphingomonas donggukensis TaxID=2949093 RepID=A0ABY4TT27_9SPHN|nr:efflux RND transporter permease subunit [Sphingomonas donggukensis]URW74866.1 efflux RND transporter permease subunit [Sphingomonas donggukensis]